MTEEQPGQGPRFDTSVASIARIYDYWLGGKDNFKVDREAAEEMIQAFPGIVAGVRMNRAFLGRAIHYLSADAGIRQFLDIGTGLPQRQQHPPRWRSAPRRIPASSTWTTVTPSCCPTPQGPADQHARACVRAYIDADLRNAGQIVKEASGCTLDFSRPVAVCLIMILQFIPDEDDPWQSSPGR